MNQTLSAWGDLIGQKEEMLAPKATGLGKAQWIKGGPGTLVQRTDLSHAGQSSLSSQESQLLIPRTICQAVTCIHLQQHQGLASYSYSIPGPLEGTLCSEIRLNETLQGFNCGKPKECSQTPNAGFGSV